MCSRGEEYPCEIAATSSSSRKGTGGLGQGKGFIRRSSDQIVVAAICDRHRGIEDSTKPLRSPIPIKHGDALGFRHQWSLEHERGLGKDSMEAVIFDLPTASLIMGEGKGCDNDFTSQLYIRPGM
ncbi:hypothetical protein Droror1_Dr00012446 [Drosera rotundifolia]